MQRREERVLTISEIVCDAAAMNGAAPERDFEEARFRALLLIDEADAAGLRVAVDARLRVIALLGSPGTDRKPGYGEAMLALATTLDDVGFDPL